MAKRKVKYDPQGEYECVRGVIRHPEAGYIGRGDGVTFTMAHRSAEEIEFLVEVKGVIAPATPAKESEVRNDSNS